MSPLELTRSTVPHGMCDLRSTAAVPRAADRRAMVGCANIFMEGWRQQDVGI